MTFSKALKKLKKGEMLCRDTDNWPSDRIVFFHQPVAQPLSYPNSDLKFQSGVYLVYRDFELQQVCSYTLSNEDLLADDWFVVEMEA